MMVTMTVVMAVMLIVVVMLMVVLAVMFVVDTHTHTSNDISNLVPSKHNSGSRWFSNIMFVEQKYVFGA